MNPYYYFKSKWFEYKEQRKVKHLFYGDSHFRSLDQAVLSAPNPYRFPKAFPYGETPLTGLHTLAKHIGLSPSDHLFELGCGRGRGAFFLAHQFGCQVTGIEWEPAFVEHGQRTAQTFHVPITFACRDFTTVDFTTASVVYLYGTCLEEASIERLNEALQTLPRGSKVITVSYALPQLTLVSTLRLRFPWGEAEVYVQQNG